MLQTFSFPFQLYKLFTFRLGDDTDERQQKTLEVNSYRRHDSVNLTKSSENGRMVVSFTETKMHQSPTRCHRALTTDSVTLIIFYIILICNRNSHADHFVTLQLYRAIWLQTSSCPLLDGLLHLLSRSTPPKRPSQLEKSCFQWPPHTLFRRPGETPSTP